MGFIDFVVVFGHFWPFLAIFGCFWPPWAHGFLEHLNKEPDVYIYPLAIAPAIKTPLILYSIHFYFSFVVNFLPCWTNFGPLLEAKILQCMTISSSAPNFILRMWDMPKNRAYLAILMGFIDFPHRDVIFGHFWPFLGSGPEGDDVL